MILLAIFFPPAYFLIRQKVGLCLITGAMFVVSMFIALMIVLIPVSLILWFIAALAAVRHYRRCEQAAQAELLATKLAEKCALQMLRL